MKKLLVLVLVVFGGLMMTGCSSQETAPTPTTPTTPSEEVVETITSEEVNFDGVYFNYLAGFNNGEIVNDGIEVNVGNNVFVVTETISLEEVVAGFGLDVLELFNTQIQVNGIMYKLTLTGQFTYNNVTLLYNGIELERNTYGYTHDLEFNGEFYDIYFNLNGVEVLRTTITSRS